MTTVDLKRTVDSLTDEERTYLAAYLKMQSLVHDPGYRADMSRRMKDMDRGRQLDSQSMKDLHQALESKGL